MKKIRVAHFGIAHDHSIFAMECIRKYSDIFEIVGICEPDEKMREEFGTHPNYEGIPWLTEEELLSRKDIDAVLCEGHELRSVSDAQKCIDKGFHVHLDKPGGTDLKVFKKLLNSAEENNLTLHMGYMYRYNPAMKYVLESVKSGKLGKITAIDAAFSIQHTAEKRQWMKQFPGGMMFFLGCHSLDMVMQINGVPTNIVAFNHSSDFENDGSMDTTLAILDYPNGACTVRSNATEANGYYKRTLKVVGTKGTIEIQPLETPTLVREAMISDGIQHPWHDYSYSVFPGYPNGRYDDMLLEFAACVRGEIKNPYSSEYEYEVQKALLKACGCDVADERRVRE